MTKRQQQQQQDEPIERRPLRERCRCGRPTFGYNHLGTVALCGACVSDIKRAAKDPDPKVRAAAKRQLKRLATVSEAEAKRAAGIEAPKVRQGRKADGTYRAGFGPNGPTN